MIQTKICNMKQVVFVFAFMVFLPLSNASVNLARGKDTRMSSEYGLGYTSDKVVDGITNRFGCDRNVCCKCCCHTDSRQRTAWWQVDLSTVSTIKNIKIYYRKTFATRFAGFHVYISNVTTIRNTLCYKDQGPNIPGVIQNIQCSYNAQYVIIYNERLRGVWYPQGYSSEAYIELCEVRVYGCQTGRYGDSCTKYCSNGCTANTCDPDTGHCSCRGNFTGQLCENCINGRYYGDNCDKFCSIGCVLDVCQRNGSCTFGCRNGFTGHKCNACIKGRYGNQCQSTCSVGCQDDVCLRYTGICYKGCKLGFVGSTTSTCDECKSGLYGYNCTEQCSDGCFEKICERENGICVKNCIKGYTGVRCNECIDGKYGNKCDLDCPDNCLNNSCNRTSGECVFGCIDNYSGRNCDECVDGKYGGSCDLECPDNCFSTKCNRTTGECSFGCTNNRDGPRCDDCVIGKYGTNCQMNCSINCLDIECNRTSGDCIHGCYTGWNGLNCNVSSDSLRNPPEENIQTATVAGTVGGILLVILVVIFVIIIFKRRAFAKSAKKDNSNRSILASAPDLNIAVSETRLSEDVKQSNAKGAVDTTTTTYNRSEIYENTTEMYYNVNESGIPIRQLKEYIAQRTKTDFKEEYKKLPEGSKFPDIHSHKPENKQKNRFQKGYCYDHSRVVLKSLSSEPGSDYINANYIDGVEQRKCYIATQGPRFNTVVDFWRMVWQVKSPIIVMLTNLVENGKVKCEKYWEEPGKELKIGHFDVKTEVVHKYPSYSLRKIHIKNQQEDQSRQVFQYHFTSWPDHGTPDPMELILFHSRIISRRRNSSGPQIIHCSAGIGRTGTFIALDALLEYGRRTGRVDIFDFVKTMRKDRMNMVQTLEQYIFLYEALAAAFEFNDTVITGDQIVKLFNNQTKIETDDETVYTDSEIVPRIETEFNLLQSQKHVHSKKDYKTATSEQNKEKNKDNCPLALDQYRPYVTSRLPQGSNYINAVFLSSYNSRNGYIITHTPLTSIIVDLWSVIVDQSSNIMILLDVQQELTELLPLNDSNITNGPFVIKRVDDVGSKTNIQGFTLNLTEKESTISNNIHVLILTHWMSGDTPGAIQDILKLVERVESCSSNSEDLGPITVICPDGANSCGLFSAIRDLIGSLKYDGEADIYQTVRQLQLRRPECISTLVQYRYLYEVLNEYLSNENVYANN